MKDATTTLAAQDAADEKRLDATVVTAEGETRGQLRAAFDAVCDRADWKQPWCAAVAAELVGLTLRAVAFFHGDSDVANDGKSPASGRILLRGNGYQC